MGKRQGFIRVQKKKDREIFAYRTGRDKYVTFAVTYGKKPKIEGTTVPISRKETKKYFGVRIPKKRGSTRKRRK